MKPGFDTNNSPFRPWCESSYQDVFYFGRLWDLYWLYVCMVQEGLRRVLNVLPSFSFESVDDPFFGPKPPVYDWKVLCYTGYSIYHVSSGVSCVLPSVRWKVFITFCVEMFKIEKKRVN